MHQHNAVTETRQIGRRDRECFRIGINPQHPPTYRVKPKGADNKAENAKQVATLQELVHDVLLAKLPARFAPAEGGIASYLTYGSQKIVGYELDTALADALRVPAALSMQPPQEPPIWMVTARDGDVDGTARFLAEGRWGLLYDSNSRFNEGVRAMRPGDVIVLKNYTSAAQNPPFPTRPGRNVSAMPIRAIGRITEASRDGLSVGVEWGPAEDRTWYFFTNNDPVWRLPDGRISASKLRAFLLEGELQDYDWFLNHPQWAGEQDARRRGQI
jgi:hypothetical protein